MKMSDVRVGVRLRSTIGGGPGFSPITVTEITERGFKYDLDAPVCVHPRLGITFAATGHEHFGLNGEAYYEPAEPLPKAARPSPNPLVLHPMTNPVVDDEMVERARKYLCTKIITTTSDNGRSMARGALEAALTPPPAEPEMEVTEEMKIVGCFEFLTARADLGYVGCKYSSHDAAERIFRAMYAKMPRKEDGKPLTGRTPSYGQLIAELAAAHSDLREAEQRILEMVQAKRQERRRRFDRRQWDQSSTVCLLPGCGKKFDVPKRRKGDG